MEDAISWVANWAFGFLGMAIVLYALFNFVLRITKAFGVNIFPKPSNHLLFTQDKSLGYTILEFFLGVIIVSAFWSGTWIHIVNTLSQWLYQIMGGVKL